MQGKKIQSTGVLTLGNILLPHRTQRNNTATTLYSVLYCAESAREAKGRMERRKKERVWKSEERKKEQENKRQREKDSE